MTILVYVCIELYAFVQAFFCRKNSWRLEFLNQTTKMFFTGEQSLEHPHDGHTIKSPKEGHENISMIY